MKISWQAIGFGIACWIIGHYRGLQAGYLRGAAVVAEAYMEKEKREKLTEKDEA